MVLHPAWGRPLSSPALSARLFNVLSWPEQLDDCPPWHIQGPERVQNGSAPSAETLGNGAPPHSPPPVALVTPHSRQASSALLALPDPVAVDRVFQQPAAECSRQRPWAACAGNSPARRPAPARVGLRLPACSPALRLRRQECLPLPANLPFGPSERWRWRPQGAGPRQL